MKVLVVIFLSMMASFAHANEISEVHGIGLAKFINDLLWFVPDSLDMKSTAKDYMAIVHPEYYFSDSQIGEANAGLANALTKHFDTDLEFQKRSVGFYSDVRDYMAQRMRGPHDDKPDDGQNGSCRDDGQGPGPYLIHYECEKQAPRILLSESAGTDRNQQYTPGWLWTLAMKASSADANEAFEMIALCGHDNRFQGSKEVKVDGVTKYLNCPTGDSAFFVPGALGKEVDIAPDLKQKIASVQNPTGRLKIPAKYYHIMAEAYVACKLIQKGHSKTSVAKVSDLAAIAYRGISICNQVKTKLDGYYAIEAQFNREKSKTSLEDFVNEKIEQDHRDYETFKKHHSLEFYNAVIVISGDLIDMRKGENSVVDASHFYEGEKRKHIIQHWLIEYDAAYLYRQWFKGGAKVLGGYTFPCTPAKISGPPDLLNPSPSFKPKGWTDDRYVRASKKVATWLIDFEWSRAEHSVGAIFASRVCHP